VFSTKETQTRLSTGSSSPGFDEAWAAGADLDLDAAVDVALRALDESGTGDPYTAASQPS
jgi:hypothetical protein